MNIHLISNMFSRWSAKEEAPSALQTLQSRHAGLLGLQRLHYWDACRSKGEYLFSCFVWNEKPLLFTSPIQKKRKENVWKPSQFTVGEIRCHVQRGTFLFHCVEMKTRFWTDSCYYVIGAMSVCGVHPVLCSSSVLWPRTDLFRPLEILYNPTLLYLLAFPLQTWQRSCSPHSYLVSLSPK